MHLMQSLINLKFHSQKCTVLSIGNNNPSFIYCMKNSDGIEITLDVVVQEKDLAVTVDKDLTFRHHANLIVSKASQIMGLIRQLCKYLDK